MNSPMGFWRYDHTNVLRALLMLPHGYVGIWQVPMVQINTGGATYTLPPGIHVRTSGIAAVTVSALLSILREELHIHPPYSANEINTYIGWLQAMTKL